jgi:hypothetical protein
MAGHRAIAAVSETIVATLEILAAGSRDFVGLRVVLVQEDELVQRLPAGISVLLREVTPSTTQRHLPTPADRAFPAIALELHYLITAWGETASAQQRLMGWCLRALHDSPVLAADLLNRADPTTPVFDPDERVELVWEPSPPAQPSGVAATLPPSLSYVARSVLLDSEVLLDRG